MIDELTKCEFEAVRELIRTNDQRYEERFKNNRETREAELQILHKRVDGINEIRAAMADQQATMQPREKAEALNVAIYEKIEQQRIAFEGQLNAERIKTAELGKPKWGLYVAIFATLGFVVSGVWQINALKIDNSVTPVQLSLKQAEVMLTNLNDRVQKIDATSQASAMADSGSRADRAQINDRLRLVEATTAARSQSVADVEALKVQAQSNGDRYAIIRADVTRQGAALVEVETQFCASDIVRNLMHANDMRIAAAMWRKVFPDSVLPTDNAYYPQVCNRLGASQTQAAR